MSALISCIVPVFNGADFIAQALDSILAQTVRPLEIVVVDDGSTDDTPSVVQRFGRFARYIRQANSGPPAARNRGVEEASGTFIAFLDCDDLWHPHKLARQIALLDQSPQAEVCVAHVRNLAAGVPLPAMGDPPEPASQGVPGYVSTTMLAHRSIFEQLGPFDPALHHGANLDWFIRAREHGARIVIDDRVLVYRRLHEYNISRLGAEQSRREHLGVLRAALRRRQRMKAQ